MYWDTLGPRWPLYADMGERDCDSGQVGDGLDNGGVGVVE
jgi:hypothetical protein